jgi:hypothetical protein
MNTSIGTCDSVPESIPSAMSRLEAEPRRRRPTPAPRKPYTVPDNHGPAVRPGVALEALGIPAPIIRQFVGNSNMHWLTDRRHVLRRYVRSSRRRFGHRWCAESATRSNGLPAKVPLPNRVAALQRSLASPLSRY